jgi:hypothetical protein
MPSLHSYSAPSPLELGLEGNGTETHISNQIVHLLQLFLHIITVDNYYYYIISSLFRAGSRDHS